jgi:hypothetical protein
MRGRTTDKGSRFTDKTEVLEALWQLDWEKVRPCPDGLDKKNSSFTMKHPEHGQCDVRIYQIENPQSSGNWHFHLRPDLLDEEVRQFTVFFASSEDTFLVLKTSDVRDILDNCNPVFDKNDLWDVNIRVDKDFSVWFQPVGNPSVEVTHLGCYGNRCERANRRWIRRFFERQTALIRHSVTEQR